MTREEVFDVLAVVAGILVLMFVDPFAEWVIRTFY